MMPMIATTMRSSINENPSWRLVVMLICCSLKFEYLRPTFLVAKWRHRRDNDQRTRVGNRGEGVVGIHHTDLGEAETTSPGRRNGAGRRRETMGAETCGRAGASLFD